MLERTTQTQTDAVERPQTLVEKLEQLSDKYLNQYKYYGDNADLNCSGAVDEAINIVKQHEAESGWISADERLPDKDGKYLVYCVGNRELTKDRKELSIMRFNQKTKGGWFALSPLFKVIYWQQIQPPSEVQDD